MIDIHSHVLPETDDGSRSTEESLEMCRIAAEDGVEVIVATPHAHDGVHQTHETSSLQQKVDDLNRRLRGRPRIVLGCELRFTHNLVNHVCDVAFAPTLNNGPYALVEFPHMVVPPGSERPLFELLSQEFRPIIAHPERNQQLMSEPERFFELVEMGALGQVDAQSLTGQFGTRVQKTARLMLESGLIHFIASDCHNTRNRVPGLSKAVSAAAEIVGEEYARMISRDNPAAILEGKPIPWRPSPALPQKKRRWLPFGR